jgi:hypothetical protein
MLVDQFISHFGDWWLIGTNDNQKWGGEGSDMWDTSNRYVEEGETGGFAAFACFLGIIYLGFARLGIARRRASNDRKKEWLVWLLGCAFFAHSTAFFGVSYFDQTQVAWLLLLAMIAAATTGPWSNRAPGLSRLSEQSRSPSREDAFTCTTVCSTKVALPEM